MPVIDIEKNINQLLYKIDSLYQEIYRLQGTLSTFQEFKKGGLKVIEIPEDPTQVSNTDKLESIQEKPE